LENQLLVNIGDLITLSPLAAEKRYFNITDQDLGRQRRAWMAISNGAITATGASEPPATYDSFERVDMAGALVLPGFVDSHTHLVWAGSRAAEFWQRLSGATYQEIAASGGGIQSTVSSTRQATNDELKHLVMHRLADSLRCGITTQEVKTGYGLTVDEEYRHLKILSDVKQQVPQSLSITCLALHAASPDHDTLESYVNDVVENLLPRVATENLADWFDAFIESGYFSVEDVTPAMEKAKELGLGLRIHADEFSDAHAAAAAANWGAVSADHLQYTNPAAMAAMAKSGTVATLLPGTSLYTNIPYTQARPFMEAGVPVAIATDFNPGSCLINNLPQMITLAALHCDITPAAALAGGTITAARALRLEQRKGHLSQGADADFVVYSKSNLESWFADMGRTAPTSVWVGGQQLGKI
jgi:imidazolonepropionase